MTCSDCGEVIEGWPRFMGDYLPRCEVCDRIAREEEPELDWDKEWP